MEGSLPAPWLVRAAVFAANLALQSCRWPTNSHCAEFLKKRRCNTFSCSCTLLSCHVGTLNAPESAGSAPKSRHQPSSRCRHLRFMEAAPQTPARHARRASAFNFWSPKADSSTFARKLLVGLADLLHFLPLEKITGLLCYQRLLELTCRHEVAKPHFS